MFKTSRTALLGQFFVHSQLNLNNKMQKYHAVNNRCAVRLDLLNLPVSTNEAIEILSNKGFTLLDVDLISLARECMKTSKYKRGARLREAPAIVDCSCFTKWLYGQVGIWLPRRSIQQSELGEKIEIEDTRAGDLVFVPGFINYFHDNPDLGIGHVGIVTESNTVIHASNSKVDIIETPLCQFVDKSKFAVVRRYIPKETPVYFFETPIEREIEVEDDFKWVILQALV